jgi:mycothiol synthase
VDSRTDIQNFLDQIEAEDGLPPMSEAKIARLASRESVVVVAEDDRVMGVGVAATHDQNDGTVHWSVETAVPRSMRFDAFEAAVVSAALGLVPRGAALSVWSSRATLSAALEDLGFAVVRSLAYMAVALPVPSRQTEHRIRRFRMADTAAFLRANADAYRDHREASSLTNDKFLELSAARWFDEAGLLLVEREEEIVGFCWTKMHPGGNGEIYRIGVVPAYQGLGIGRALLLAGLQHIEAQPQVERATLWVDTANASAMTLYTSIGMSIERVNSEYER